MGTVILAARALLAVVFALAAITKASSPSSSRSTFMEFGAGQRVARVAALSLPAAELAIAVTIMIVPLARWAAAGAMLLLLIFLAGIGNALREGRTPDCGCFGAVRPAPIGTATLVRNVAFLLVAALILAFGPGPEGGAWLGARSAAVLVGLGALATALVALLVRTMSSSARRVEKPGSVAASPPPQRPSIGQPAPIATVRDVLGQVRTLETQTNENHPLLVIFLSAGCAPCLALISHIGRWQAIFAGRIRIAVVGPAEVDEIRELCLENGITNVLVDQTGDLRLSYDVHATPWAVAVAPTGTIASSHAIGRDAIEDLLRLTLHQFDPSYDPWRPTATAI